MKVKFLSHHTFESEKILGFLFSTENILTWGVKFEKLNVRKT